MKPSTTDGLQLGEVLLTRGFDSRSAAVYTAGQLIRFAEVFTLSHYT